MLTDKFVRSKTSAFSLDLDELTQSLFAKSIERNILFDVTTLRDSQILLNHCSKLAIYINTRSLNLIQPGFEICDRILMALHTLSKT
jgi:hypothetical protein